MKKLLMQVALCVFIASSSLAGQAEGPFEPTVESLSQYETPEWFRDAKFGIYTCWSAHSASKSWASGWYSRNMYIEGHPAYEDHLKNWGHPSEVGYKDVIKAWEGDQFDAEEWIRLFKDAGAKYVLTVAVHCDNFDLWDSKYQPKWNSTNYGPKVDVAAEMRRETLKAGLRWGVTTHLSRSYSWLQTNKGADQSGPYKGVPYDGNDPEYEDLYLEYPNFEELGNEGNQKRHPLKSPESWKTHWKNRMFDLIDNYHPDHFYFDGAVPFMDDEGQAGLDVIAHYYNHNASRHGGKNEGVMVFKKHGGHGIYYPGISNEVMERKSSSEIEPIPKQTENSVGPWYHQPGEPNYRTSASLLHEMIDTVSKNNNYLLNIPPTGDGRIDEASREILSDFGQWFRVNGEAIYESRPWHVFGESNVRFTTRGNALYVFFMEELTSDLTIQSLREWSPDDIKEIELLGRDGNVSWTLSDKGLEISAPKDFESLAAVFKITCTKDPLKLPVSEVPVMPSVEEANRKFAEEYGSDGEGLVELPEIEAFTRIKLSADVENSSSSAFGGSVRNTVNDPSIGLPQQSWTGLAGFAGNLPEGEAVKLVYSLEAGPITLADGKPIVVELFGRNQFNDRSRDIDIELYSGGVDGKLVASVTELAIPDTAPYLVRGHLLPKSAFDTIVITGHDTTAGDRNQFTLMEIRAWLSE